MQISISTLLNITFLIFCMILTFNLVSTHVHLRAISMFSLHGTITYNYVFNNNQSEFESGLARANNVIIIRTVVRISRNGPDA